MTAPYPLACLYFTISSKDSEPRDPKPTRGYGRPLRLAQSGAFYCKIKHRGHARYSPARAPVKDTFVCSPEVAGQPP